MRIIISNISPEADEIDLLNISGGKTKVKTLEIENRIKRDLNIDVPLLIERELGEVN